MKKIINNAKSKINTIRNGRANEVGFVIDMINILCKNCDIELISSNENGTNEVKVRDTKSKKIYSLK